MDWEKVAEYLATEAFSLCERADHGFPNDSVTRNEMWGRARIARLLADALRAGISHAPAAEG